MRGDRGFTLVEILLSLAILSIIIIGIHQFFQNYLDASLGEKKIGELQGNVKLALNVIEQDIKTASFGMPPATRAASHNGGGVIINTTLTDRLFLANGWEILRDFTNNSMEDGTIADADYADIAGQKGQQNTGGYAGTLTAAANAGAASITLTDLDIDAAGAPIPNNDFNEGESLILYANTTIEGHRIGTIADPTINFITGETLANNYPQATTQVVPSIAYYIANINGTWWLCRNGVRVLADVQNLQVEYGYDRDRDGAIEMPGTLGNEWVADIPSPFDPNFLMAVRVTIIVNLRHQRRFEIGKTSQYTYVVTGDFRN